MLGTLVHLGIDALLISAFLAGIKRTTGLTYVNNLAWATVLRGFCCLYNNRPALSRVPNKDVRREFILVANSDILAQLTIVI